MAIGKVFKRSSRLECERHLNPGWLTEGLCQLRSMLAIVGICDAASQLAEIFR